MKTQRVQATFPGGEARLSLFLYIDDSVHVCYAPELDLFGYGHSETEALDSFTIVLNEYLGYVIDHKTLGQDLRRLGWTVDDRQKKFTAPPLHQLLLRNEDFSQTLANRPFRKLDRLVALSA